METPNLDSKIRELLNGPIGLMLIDLQNDFLSPKGKSASLWHQDISRMVAILPVIEQVTAAFHNQGLPVIRTVNYEDPKFRTDAGLDRLNWFEKADPENNVACLKGTWGAELFTPAATGDHIIEKYRSSAYIGTSLKELIHSLNLNTLIIAGVKTQRCVFRTVSDLYENEPHLHVITLEDAVASDDLQSHETFLRELKRYYPPVVDSKILLSIMNS